MLERPPSAERKRQQRRARDRRYEARKAAGLAVAPVPYCGMILDYLIRLRWLDDRDANDKAKVGEAISAVVRESAEAALMK